MCGICGIYLYGDELVGRQLLSEMSKTLAHRGPDNEGIFVSNHVGLAHRRLSVIDLSEQANQPFYSENKRYTIAYNGEIYNYLELKEKLEINGFRFRTTSDTEVILAAYQVYGASVFETLEGMFAIAIYDNEKQQLILARDSLGIKPLYYYRDENRVIFASEIKAILENNNVNKEINQQALVEYLWYGNALGENTIYRQIAEFPNGKYAVISEKKIFFKKFHQFNQDNKSVAEDQAIEQVRDLLETSVKKHMISDVPIGIFLSGGIDSSAITAFAAQNSSQPIKTYSVKFDFDKGVNELPLARKVAERYKTDHHEIEIKGKDLPHIIETLVDAHDEPFADAANIPLYLLTQQLKGEVKVVLQGDGGDELFGGYSRYKALSELKKWRRLKPMISILNKIPIRANKFLQIKRFLIAITEKDENKRRALLLTMETEQESPLRVLKTKYQEVLKTYNPFLRYQEVGEVLKDRNSIQKMFYTDMQIILKDTFLEKVDKSTMQNAIEVRVPFLDKPLVDYCLRISANVKLKNGEQKYLLKKALRGIVPDEILDGKKKGFGVPYGFWLQQSLQEYFWEQLGQPYSGVIFDSKEIQKMYQEHLKDKGNYGYILWKILILAVWLNKNEVEFE